MTVCVFLPGEGDACYEVDPACVPLVGDLVETGPAPRGQGRRHRVVRRVWRFYCNGNPDCLVEWEDA